MPCHSERENSKPISFYYEVNHKQRQRGPVGNENSKMMMMAFVIIIFYCIYVKIAFTLLVVFLDMIVFYRLLSLYLPSTLLSS